MYRPLGSIGYIRGKQGVPSLQNKIQTLFRVWGVGFGVHKVQVVFGCHLLKRPQILIHSSL